MPISPFRIVPFLLLFCSLPAGCQAPTQTRVTAFSRITGRVLDAEGGPVPGAMVALLSDSPTDANLAVLDASGGFKLEHAPGKNLELTVSAPGFLPHFRLLSLEPGEDHIPVEIRLARGGHPVRGTVTPAKGHSLEGLRLSFALRVENGYSYFFTSTHSQHFNLNLAPGSYIVEATTRDQSFIGGRFGLTSAKLDLDIKLRLEPTPADLETIEWIRSKAIPLQSARPGQGLKDLQALSPVFGDARVVALGEATHGTKEFFQLKHRILEYLVETKGFTTFAMEANLPEAMALDRYLLTGEGDPAEILATTHPVWNVEEVLALVRWMRHYNTQPGHPRKLRFYGFDMQEKRRTAAQAMAWLASNSPASTLRLADLLRQMDELAKAKGNDPGRSNAWEVLSESLEALAQDVEKRPLMPDRAHPGEEPADQSESIHRLSQYAAFRSDTPRGLRDQFMAANLMRRLSRDENDKILIWAHNGHISQAEGAMYGANPMGWHLKRSLGNTYRGFGFAFGSGAFRAWDMSQDQKGVMEFEATPLLKNTLDAALGAAGHPIFALDLRNLPKGGPIREWFDSPQGTWDIGAGYSPLFADRFIQKEPVTACYDALLFVSTTTATTPMKAH